MSSAATNSSKVFPGLPGQALTIYHNVAATGSATGTWTLEAYNYASAAWEEVTDASSEFTNPAGGAASGIANYVNPVVGILRVTFTHSSGTGSATGATIKIKGGPRNR